MTFLPFSPHDGLPIIPSGFQCSEPLIETFIQNPEVPPDWMNHFFLCTSDHCPLPVLHKQLGPLWRVSTLEFQRGKTLTATMDCHLVWVDNRLIAEPTLEQYIKHFYLHIMGKSFKLKHEEVRYQRLPKFPKCSMKAHGQFMEDFPKYAKVVKELVDASEQTRLET